ncbi:MAG TPA: hypothetical protein VEV45_17750 [Streptosporangiaceae bacterium]|nr:hypothetical protein [Streptosporangiaceae bacterium]
MGSASHLQGHGQLEEQRRIANATEELAAPRQQQQMSLGDMVAALYRAGVLTEAEFLDKTGLAGRLQP